MKSDWTRSLKTHSPLTSAMKLFSCQSESTNAVTKNNCAKLSRLLESLKKAAENNAIEEGRCERC